MEKPKGKQSVVKSALKMSLGTMSSRVLGFVRDTLIQSIFPRTVTDAFVIAFRLPNFVRRFLGEGALNVSFVPVFIEQMHGAGDEELRKARALRLSNSIFTLLTCITMTISVLGILFMQPLMETWVRGENYANVPGKMELTILFGRIMFVYVYLVTGYAFLTAVANSLRSFFIPALAPAVFNALVIVGVFIPNTFEDYPGLWLAISVVAGGVVQLVMVAIQLFKMGALPRLTFDIRVPGFAQVMKSTLPALFGLGILQVISLVNVSFGAMLPEGTHTYLYNGDRLLELPQSIIAISLGTALLPSLSELLAQGKKSEMLEMAAKYMRLLMFLALPCSVGLYILARPIVETLFGRGQFGPEDVAGTTLVIQIYSVLLLGSSLMKVIVPSFYALKDTRTPAMVSAIVVIIHIAVTPFLMNKMGLAGLAWGTTISGFSNMVMLLAVYRAKVGELYVMKLLMSVLKSMPALLVMGAVAFYSHLFLIEALGVAPSGVAREIVRAVVLFAAIGLSGITYFGIAHLCRVEEARMFFDTVKRKWNRKRNKSLPTAP